LQADEENHGVKISFRLTLLAVANFTAAAETGVSFPDYVLDENDRILSEQRSLYDTLALGRMAARLKASRHNYWIETPDSKAFPTYKQDPGWGKEYLFQLRLDSMRFEDAGDSAWLYRVNLECFSAAQEEWHLAPSQAFLRSAYVQELIPDFVKEQPEVFLPRLSPKSYRSFWLKNSLSMGYGADYLADGNPFSPELGSTSGWGYLWDAVLYSLSGISIAKGDYGYAARYLGVSAIGKLLWIGSKAGHLEHYNRIAASGYQVPNYVYGDSLWARERSAQRRQGASAE